MAAAISSARYNPQAVAALDFRVAMQISNASVARILAAGGHRWIPLSPRLQRSIRAWRNQAPSRRQNPADAEAQEIDNNQPDEPGQRPGQNRRSEYL